MKTVELPNAESDGPVVGPAKERRGTMDYDALAQMPLESLLYYVLVGEGRKRNEPAEGENFGLRGERVGV